MSNRFRAEQTDRLSHRAVVDAVVGGRARLAASSSRAAGQSGERQS